MGLKPGSSDVKLEEEDNAGDDGGNGDGNDMVVMVIMTIVVIMTNTQPSAARHCHQHFAEITSFKVHSNPMSRYHYDSFYQMRRLRYSLSLLG